MTRFRDEAVNAGVDAKTALGDHLETIWQAEYYLAGQTQHNWLSLDGNSAKVC